MRDKITYRVITTSDLTRYQSVILPVVYEKLFESKDLLEDQYLCIGALKEKPVGAIVVQIDEADDLNLRSLMVSSDCRRQRIGLTLLDKMLQVVVQTSDLEEEESLEICMKAMYALNEKNLKQWQEFLKAAGFSNFLDLGNAYQLERTSLEKSQVFAPVFQNNFVPDPKVKCAIDLPLEEKQQLVEESDVLASLEYSFVTDEPDCWRVILLVEETEEHYFHLQYLDLAEGVPVREGVAVLQAAVHAIASSHPYFQFVLTDHRIPDSPLKKLLPLQDAKTYHSYATWKMGTVAKDDVSYARFGQKMATKMDIERAKQSKEYNMRMRGLTPALTAENIRWDKGAEIHSMKYIPENVRGNTVALSHQSMLLKEFTEFKDTLSGRLGKDKTNHSELFRLLEEKWSNVNDGMNLSLAFTESWEQYSGLRRSEQNRQSAIEDSNQQTEIINDFIQFLNQVYSTTLGGDDKLSLAFHHMISVLERVREMYYKSYSTFEAGDKQRDAAEYASRRDDYSSVGIETENGKRLANDDFSYAQLAGMVRVFGSIKNGIIAKDRLDELNDKENKTNEEDRELERLERKIITVSDFAKADRYYLGRRRFTKEDVDFAFSQIPKGEEGITFMEANEQKVTMKPSKIYQSLFYEKIFPGIKDGYAKQFPEMSKDGDEEARKVSLNQWLYPFLSSNLEDIENRVRLKDIIDSFVSQAGEKKQKVELEEVMTALNNSFMESYLEGIIGRMDVDDNLRDQVLGYNLSWLNDVKAMEAYQSYRSLLEKLIREEIGKRPIKELSSKK